MSEKRISDEDLAYFRRDMSAMDGEHVDMLLDEVISLRAAALTDRDAANLRRLVDVIRGYHERNGRAPTGTTLDLCDALARVIAEHPTGADQ